MKEKKEITVVLKSNYGRKYKVLKRKRIKKTKKEGTKKKERR